VRIQLEECPPDDFALKLRVPRWADKPSLRVSGSASDRKLEPDTYAEVRRRWKPGDVVELRLGMAPKFMESHPLVEETSRQVAIQRGPVVYCLESLELPKGVRIRDVAIAKGAELRHSFEPELLQGVGIVETDVVASSSSEWKQELYRPLSTASVKKMKVRLIPYFAWANRGKSEMSVWLPRD
jgi:DUF1680 family protein